jgi:hypothetical protein
VATAAQEAHDVLAFAAVATTPLGRWTLDACGLGERKVEHALGRGLLVVGRMDGEPAVEPVHDLVRVSACSVLETGDVEQGLLEVLLGATPIHPSRIAHHMANLNHPQNPVWASQDAGQDRTSFSWEQGGCWYDVAVAHGYPKNDVDWMRAELVAESGRVAEALAAWTDVAETSPTKSERVLALAHGAALAYGMGEMATGHALADPAVRTLGRCLRRSVGESSRR